MGSTFFGIMVVTWLFGFLSPAVFGAIAGAWFACAFAERYFTRRWVRMSTVDEIKRDNVRLQGEVRSAAAHILDIQTQLVASRLANETLAARATSSEAVRQARVEAQQEILRLYVTNKTAFMGLMMEFAAREQARAKAGSAKSRAPTGENQWWDVLGVDERASHDTVRSAFKALAKRYHPDNPQTGNAARMKQINLAWEQAEVHFG